MEISEALRTRRSIRKFTAEEVSKDDIQTILQGAMLAPSACNEQPWHFVVVTDQAQREKLSHTSPYTGMAKEAPLVIIVCGDLREEKARGFWVQDCSAATENILLAARGLELASVWCGVHPEQEREEFIKKALGLPEQVIPFALVCIGHSRVEFKEVERFKPERVHYGAW